MFRIDMHMHMCALIHLYLCKEVNTYVHKNTYLLISVSTYINTHYERGLTHKLTYFSWLG